MLNSTAPTTKKGIEKYLGSGMVKGIGPIYAKKLVASKGSTAIDPDQFKRFIVSGLFSYLGVPALVLKIWSMLRSLVLPDGFERP